MPRRPILPADDSAAHAAWIAEAVAAVFHFPRLLPILRRRAEPRLPEPRLPDLFIDLPNAQAAQPESDMPAPVAEALSPVPAGSTMELTFDMGRFRDAPRLDRCEPGDHGYKVASPPFYLHDEDHFEPLDEFLGQVVGFRSARALLFRRRDPCVMDGCEVGQRYVMLRFWDDEEGEAWCMPVEGDCDTAVSTAMLRTLTLYRRGRRKAA
ncbi:hypothetical protein [Methylobacterium sp. Leaf117]|uniref:hypothetical protein n=1 Tax=Methylobacterium sp. Leaf117 TaxID=1736260 RepID=UPI0006FAB9FD|nr:hypothetical protein [Methylobacterium sp. Leaf117]KQP92965.1 hypothetical protein ASF57_22675 [Methylobacterium sp. Leaf117]